MIGRREFYEAISWVQSSRSGSVGFASRSKWSHSLIAFQGDRRDMAIQNGHAQLQLRKDGTYRIISSRTPPERSWHTKVLPAINIVSEPLDSRGYSLRPESPPPLLFPGFNESVAEDLINARMEFDIQASRYSEQDSGTDKYSTYRSTDISEDQGKNPSRIDYVGEVSTTIFQSSANVPISIIVTEPPKEISEPVNSPPNPQFLMPPKDNQFDPCRLHEAQESREIREWLITFLNSKGDEFPRKVRLRMMDLYCIREYDLAPEIVAKFDAEVQDEGATSEQQYESVDDEESLSILRAAFRSQIEEIVAKKEKIVPPPLPPSLERQGSPLKKVETKDAEAVMARKESRQPTPAKDAMTEDFDIDLEPPWFEPLISTSASSRDSLLTDQRYHKKACSASSLTGSQPQLNRTDSTHSLPGLRPRGSKVAEENAQRKQSGPKRSSFLSGAFEAMRDAMRRPPKKESKKNS